MLKIISASMMLNRRYGLVGGGRGDDAAGHPFFSALPQAHCHTAACVLGVSVGGIFLCLSCYLSASISISARPSVGTPLIIPQTIRHMNHKQLLRKTIL